MKGRKGNSKRAVSLSQFSRCPFSEAAVQVWQARRSASSPGLLQLKRATAQGPRGKSMEEAEREKERCNIAVACLAPRLTRTVYCSTPEALGTSLAGIAARGFLGNRLEKLRRGRD